MTLGLKKQQIVVDIYQYWLYAATMKARLRFYVKNKIQNRFILELSIHEIDSSLKYPDGIKYGLICKDLKTGNFVLMDNHHPKGPHIHINKNEIIYKYVNDEKLLEDFSNLVLNELGVKL